jgi:hypothetical protein
VLIVDWSSEFDLWYNRLIERGEAGDQAALEQLALVDAELGVLQDLDAEPELETPSLRRIVQSRKYPVWRVAHPFVAGTAMRLIAWFPPVRPGEVVIVLFGADKAQMGDVFYNSVGPRADAAIESFLYRTEYKGERDD